MPALARSTPARRYTWVLGLSLLLPPLLIMASASRATIAAPAYHSGVTDLWGGAVESIARRADGTVWAWGWDEFGVLGNGHGLPYTDTSTIYDSWLPFEVLGPNGVGHLTSIQAIAGGERHNAALDTNGNVWTCGWNRY